MIRKVFTLYDLKKVLSENEYKKVMTVLRGNKCFFSAKKVFYKSRIRQGKEETARQVVSRYDINEVIDYFKKSQKTITSTQRMKSAKKNVLMFTNLKKLLEDGHLLEDYEDSENN
jgi:glycine/serine hydroxymethyltransferase